MTGKHSPHVRAILWVLPCIAAWSLIPLLASNTGGLDSHQYLFGSSLVSAASLTLCAHLMGYGPALRAYSSTDLRRLIALASLGAFGYYALLYWAYAPCPDEECLGKPLVIIIGQYTWPAFSVLWSAILLGEHLTRRMILSLGLGIVAVWFGASTGVASGDAVDKLPLVLMAAVMFGLYSTLLKRIDYEPFSSLAVSFSAATAMSFVSMMLLSVHWKAPGWKGFWAVVVNGVFVNGLSYVCWYRALRAAPITFVAPWVALTPLIAAMVTSHSQSGDVRWIGICLVLVSVLLAMVPSPGSSHPTRTTVPHGGMVEESASV